MKLLSKLKLSRYSGQPKTIDGSLDFLGDEAKELEEQLANAYRNGKILAKFNSTHDSYQRLEQVASEFFVNNHKNILVNIEYYYDKAWQNRPTFSVSLYLKR